MRLWKKAIIALVLAFALVRRAPAESIPIPVINWYENNVVHVGTPSGGGTGFFIEPNLLITACHVVDENPFAFISKEGYLNQYMAVVGACDTETDLALLTINKVVPGITQTIFAERQPRSGKQTYGGGYPFGLPLIVGTGFWQREGPFSGAYLDTTHTLPGESGSPLVVFEDGEVKVVAVRTAVLRIGPPEEGEHVLYPNIEFVSPIHMIQDFLHENL